MSIVINKQLKILRNDTQDNILEKNKINEPIAKPQKSKEDLNNKQHESQKKSNETNSKFYSKPIIFKEAIKNINDLTELLKRENPQFLEKFELQDYIKNGSAGSVIRANYKIKSSKNSSNKIVALKFLNNAKGKRKSQDHSEIMIHGSLKHKNFPAIYGYYKIGENSCIAMEMAHYGDLDNFKRKIIKRSPLSETLICFILGGLVEAVYYIHTHNKIIHMDIKQQNVLVDDYLNIKLTDFSVSVCYKNMKKIDLPHVGTCYYMAPEVLRKETINASDASKIDIYSIGVLLYLLAFGDYPYELANVDNKNYDQILDNVEKKELIFPKDNDCSKVFLNLIKNCLNKDLKSRYNIFQMMKDPFYQGYKIILDEKEKLYNAGKLIIDLMVDNMANFNQYIKEKEKNMNFY